jgi:metal-responsive CopG/Arc/MetJ family transcriptional regulator
MAKSIQINTKYPEGIVEEMERVLKKNNFRSKGELIVHAVRQYLEHERNLERGQVFESFATTNGPSHRKKPD